MSEVLKDHEAVAFFIQYLEACKASSLIRFYLDAESFQASTWTRIRTHSLHSISRSSIVTEQADQSMSSMSKSINKDITSPDSSASVDSIGDAVPGIVVTVPSSETVSKDSTDPNQNSLNTAQQQPNQNCQTEDANSKADNIVKEEFPSKSDCDTRVQEKCKVVNEKTNMTLPLENCDSSNVGEEGSSSLDNSDGAVSYRELASSPTTSSGRGRNNSQSSAKSDAASVSSHSSNLAQKLKKSKIFLKLVYNYIFHTKNVISYIVVLLNFKNMAVIKLYR